jgi:hypothetical protein
VIAALLLRNPFTSLLGAITFAMLAYIVFLKGDNAILERQVEHYKLMRENAAAEAKAATAKNATLAAIQKQQFQAIQQEADRAKTDAKEHRARIDVLLIRLRNANRCAVPATSAATESSAATITPELPREGGTIFDRLAEEYANLADSAEQTRITAIACQRALGEKKPAN